LGKCPSSFLFIKPQYLKEFSLCSHV
jgi:hypothetical protein